jgi:processive 1,2-diacylglycerol beta-glucosyltransferase
MDFGVPGSNIQYNGPVFNSRFNESKTDNQYKEFATSKGLDLDLPIVEIISGGASLPKGFEVFKETLEALESNQKKFQIVLICGRNESLKQRAKKLLSQYPQLQKFVKIEGFSTEIYDWMNIATIIVSKAGPGIMQEAWALCKPFFACNRIWPQEQMNFDLINQKEVGVADMDPRFLIKEILRCVNDKNELKTYRDNLLALDYRSNINEVTKGILGVE